MSIFSNLYGETISALTRFITGRLFTEKQIKEITSGAVGKYLTDFFPTPKDEKEARDKVEAARKHIEAASGIISGMQQNLENQSKDLKALLVEVEEKKALAERYETLAKTNQNEFSAFREEMEDSLKSELENQARKGRRLRQFVSFIIWVLTLIAGAALGTYFKNIIDWFNAS